VNLNVSFLDALFFTLVCLTLLTAFVVWPSLLFSFATSKAYFFRIMVEATFPLYIYLILSRQRQASILRHPVALSLLASLTVNFVAALLGQDMLRSVWGNLERMGGVFFQGHLLLFFLYVMYLAQIGHNYLRRFLMVVIAIGACAALHGIITKVTNNAFLGRDQWFPRVSGTFGNPAFFASFLVVVIFVTLIYSFHAEQRRWVKVLCLAITGMEVYCLLLTETRGAVIGLIAAVALSTFLAIVLSSGKHRRLYALALIGFVAVVVVGFALHRYYPEGSILRRVSALADEDSEVRLLQWGASLRGIRDHPLWGVGPENYYIVANKYPSHQNLSTLALSFDKPHNYILEVLVTTGMFGFAAYASMLVVVFWSISRAFRRQILRLPEFCLLVAALVAYTVQNMFLFETISASVLFYVLLAMAGLFWHQRKQESSTAGTGGRGRWYAVLVALACSLCMAWTIYKANISGIRIAAALQDGYLYSLVYPERAFASFEMAEQLPFLFDPAEMAHQSGNFAELLALSADGWHRETSLENVLNASIRMQRLAISRVPNDPRAYDSIARLYVLLATIKKEPLDPRADQAITRALELAPGKQALLFTKARIRLAQGNVHAAKSILQTLLQEFPANLSAQIEMARFYWLTGNEDAGLAVAQRVLEAGYIPPKALELDWIAAAYEKRNDYQAAKMAYELDVQSHANNSYDYWQLAQVCAKLGEKRQATAIARTIQELEPSREKEMEDFISKIIGNPYSQNPPTQ
jgi:O-antigen ligase